MKKIMISVAPVAATDILINPRAIARDVYECYKHGAAMVHLHCRDLNGRPLGIQRVMVNGQWAVKDGAFIPGSLHGKFLLK